MSKTRINCFIYTGQDMDGEAVIHCFTRGFRDVVPTLGKRVKVYSAIKRRLEVS